MEGATDPEEGGRRTRGRPPTGRDGPRVGRPARLSREVVLAAALALADEEGLEALSMRRLAAELGCGVMTLYTYVRDRDDLMSGLVGLLIAEIDLERQPAVSWDDEILRGAAAYRAMALRHRRSFAALALAPSSDPGLQAHLRRIVDTLVAAGLGERAARELSSVADSFASGFLLMELSEPDAPAEDDPLEPLDEAAYWRGFELIIAGAERVLTGRAPGIGLD